MTPLDARIGHQCEKCHENKYGKDNWRDVQEERHRLAEEPYVGKQGTEGLQEDVEAACNDYNKWKENEDADVVDYLAIDGARAFHEPNGIEGRLNVCR